MTSSSIQAILVINNAISGRLAELALAHDGIDPSQCYVFTLRRFEAPWMREAAGVLQYPGFPAFDPWGQVRFLSFFRRAGRELRRLLAGDAVRKVYLVNCDNLITSHLLAWARGRSNVEVVVLAEGLMNFQDIQLRNRAWWRAPMKAVMSSAVGLRWQAPTGHLSGAFDPAVGRVVSFAAEGLFAPPEKVQVLRFHPVEPRVHADPGAALLAQTGLWQWMTPEHREEFAQSFVQWVWRQGFARLYIKRHPNYDTRFIEERLPPHELFDRPGSLEDLAPDLPAATIVSTNCTALVTLRMLRPDLRCVDYGADFYCRHAYYGDESVLAPLRATGVELVDSEPAVADPASARAEAV